MKISRFLFLIISLCLSNCVGARNYYSSNDSLNKYQGRFFFGAYVGIPSYCTMGRNNESIELITGYKEIAFTGRFYRAWGSNGYFFEDAIEVGWKKKFWKGFNNTVSGGYSNLAFENDIIDLTIPEISRGNFHKTSGLILEEKLGYNFHWKNSAPSVWGISVNYYCVFNSVKTIQGWSAGIDFLLDDMYWKNPNRKSKRKHIITYEPPVFVEEKKVPEEYTLQYKFRIRTNFITGMFFSPHIDFEHRYSKNWGFGIGVFARPDYDMRPRYAIFPDPDYQLTGGGGFVDWIYFKPIWKNDHYWTFALRCGYRNLSGSCAIGDKLSSPDYYIKRKRQDIVTAWRVSFVMPPRNSHWSIDWYFTAGARTSFYKTKFPAISNPYWNPEASFSYPKTGCYVLPEFVGGFEFGFGW